MSQRVQGADVELWNYFHNKQAGNSVFQNMQSSFSDAKLEFGTIIHSDVMNEPIRQLARATNDTIDTIQTLAGVRLFMLKGAFNYGNTPVQYSACFYFSQT